MTLLHMASLQEVFNLNDPIIGENLVNNRISFISKFYDNWFIQILKSMLVFDENHRPDFCQLIFSLNNIDNINDIKIENNEEKNLLLNGNNFINSSDRKTIFINSKQKKSDLLLTKQKKI